MRRPHALLSRGGHTRVALSALDLTPSVCCVHEFRTNYSDGQPIAAIDHNQDMGGPGPRTLAASEHTRCSHSSPAQRENAVASIGARDEKSQRWRNLNDPSHRRGRLREVLHRLRDVGRALPLPHRHAADEAAALRPRRRRPRGGREERLRRGVDVLRRSSPRASACFSGTAPSSAAGRSAGGPACRSTARSRTRTTTTCEAPLPPCITESAWSKLRARASVGVFCILAGRRRGHLSYAWVRPIKAPPSPRPSPAARGSGPRGGP